LELLLPKPVELGFDPNPIVLPLDEVLPNPDKVFELPVDVDPELFPNPDTVLDEPPELFPNPEDVLDEGGLFPNEKPIDPVPDV